MLNVRFQLEAGREKNLDERRAFVAKEVKVILRTSFSLVS